MPSDILIRISGDPALFKAAMGQVSASLDQVNGKVGLSSNRMAELGSRLATIGNTLSLGVTAPVLAFGAATLKAAVEMDSLKRGLETVEGSAEKARATLIRLEEAARRPGLGFKEAISGFTSLRAAGLDANLAERSLSAFGNALATVGKGKADLDGVTLALTQIATKAVFSAQELNQLAERVPQIRLAVQAAFGTGDTEKITKLGLGNTEIIRRLVVELEKLPQASDSARNQLDNLGETIGKAAARIGEELLPHVREAVPKIEEMVKGGIDLFNAFKQLPGPIKDTAIAFGLLTIAAGPILTAAGNLGRLAAAAGTAGKAIGALGGVLGTGVTMLLTALIRDLPKIRQELDPRNWNDTAFQGFTGKSRDMERSLQSLISTAGGLNFVPSTFQIIADATGNLRSKVLDLGNDGPPALDKHAKAHEEHFKRLLRVTTESAVLMELASKAEADYGNRITDIIPVLKSYSTVFVAEALRRARALDVLFQSFRQLEDAPEITMGIEFDKLPKVPMPTFPGAPDVDSRDPEFVAMGRNQGPTGMQTREQFEAMKRGSRDASREGSRTLQQVSTILTDLSRGIANAGIGLIFNRAKADVSKYTEEIADLTIEQNKLIASQAKGNNVTVQLTRVQEKLADANRRMGEELRKASLGFRALEAGKSIVADLAKSITRVLIEGALTALSKKLLDIGGLFGKVFGGAQNASGTIFSAASGGGSAAGGAASSAGSASSGASSAIGGIGGWIGIGAQVASAVSGVIGNFQMAHMNTALGRIEESTRFSQIHLLHTLEKANEYWPYMKGVWESLVRMESRSVSIAGAGGETYNFNFAGAQFGAGFNQAQAEAIFTTVVTKFKQKGLSK